MATLFLFEILETSQFSDWIDNLKDQKGRARILVRIERLREGNPGDSKSVGNGVNELRLAFGPGYRIYYQKIGTAVLILLAGGDKGSQERDVRLAKEIARWIELNEKYD